MLVTEETFKPRKFVAVLPLIVPLVTAILYNRMEAPQQQSLLWFSAGCTVLSLVMYVLLRAVEIRIEQQGIVFKAIAGERTIAWRSLQSVYVRRISTGKTTRRELVFEPGNGEKRATVNIRLYSRRELQAIALAVVAMAPQARIDEKVRGFAEGRFPWNLP